MATGFRGGVSCFDGVERCGLFLVGDLSNFVRTLSTRWRVALLSLSDFFFLCFLDFLWYRGGGEGEGDGVYLVRWCLRLW